MHGSNSRGDFATSYFEFGWGHGSLRSLSFSGGAHLQTPHSPTSTRFAVPMIPEIKYDEHLRGGEGVVHASSFHPRRGGRRQGPCALRAAGHGGIDRRN